MLQLNAKLRDKTKKADFYRKNAQLPAIVYGPKMEPQNLVVDYKEFNKVYKDAGGSSIVQLSVEDGKQYDILIHDVAIDPILRNFIHADFYSVPSDEEITTSIPVVFIGESDSVKLSGGILSKNIQEIEVSCLPKYLPKELKADLSLLNTFEDNIKVSDLNIPEYVKIKIHADDIIVSVLPPRSEEELKGLSEQAAAPSLEEIKVVGEEKRKAEEAEKEEAK